MELKILDIIAFVGFLVLVIGVSLYQSRKEESSEDYFLAGRGLTWWMIGLSLIASNISTEHFVGMAGQGFKEGIGMAIASYEWIAALSLIVVAVFLLPRFLRAGIYTLPEYLEYRYDWRVRTLMSGVVLLFYVGITMAAVLFTGAKPLQAIFGIDLRTGIWMVGLIAGAYTVYGGLKAVVWSDIIQASALLIGGAIVTILGFQEVGGWKAFAEMADGRLDAVLPANHPEYPWVAIFIGGMWIPNLYYWGLNQWITQRTLGAKNLREGQKGILFGASLKLIIPLIVVLPGIMAYELYLDQIPLIEVNGEMVPDVDSAYPILLKNILPTGLIGIMLAALFGAVMSTLDSLLNSAATIFTMDIYKPFINRAASDRQMIRTGRIATVVFILVACLWAPVVFNFQGGIYKFLQLYWGFIQPGIVAVFFLGILWRRVSANAAIAGMLLNVPVYGALLHFFPDVAFLHHMMLSFVGCLLLMISWSLVAPNKKEIVIPVRDASIGAEGLGTDLKVWSGLIVLTTIALYIFFS